MKQIIIITALLFFGVLSSFSQRIVNESIDVEGKNVKMEFTFADNITIEAWNKNTIELQVSVNIDDNTYNDFYSLKISKGENSLELNEDVDFDGIKEKIGKSRFCDFNTDLFYTLKVPENLEFGLNTISGEIELIGCLGEMDINTISGFIDYSIPKSHDAKIDLSTVTGDVYSNVKFENKLSDEISWVGTNQQLSLNGGNVDVGLKTVSGDIYLREK